MPKGYKNIGDGLYINKSGKVYSKRANRHIGVGARATISYYGEIVQVAHIIAENYCERPQGTTIVHHLDANPANNAANNLMWVTVEQHKQIHANMRAEMQKYFSHKKNQEKVLKGLTQSTPYVIL